MTHPEDGRTDAPAPEADAAETAELGTSVPSTAEQLPAAGATPDLPPREAVTAAPPHPVTAEPAPATSGDDVTEVHELPGPAAAAEPAPTASGNGPTDGATLPEPAAAAGHVSGAPADVAAEHPTAPTASTAESVLPASTTGAGAHVPAVQEHAQPTSGLPAEPSAAPADGTSADTTPDTTPYTTPETTPDTTHTPGGSVAAGSTAGAATAAAALADPHAPGRPDPDTGAGDEPSSAATPRRFGLPVVLTALLALLLLAVVAFLGYQLRQQQLTETARDEATTASREAARLLFSYDHAKLDEDFAKGLATTTGKFTDEYSRTTKEVVAPVAKEYKAVVVADVVESAVVRAEPDEVTALVFLNQATTSTRVTGQQVDQSRVRMTLVKRGDRWLVSEVKAL